MSDITLKNLDAASIKWIEQEAQQTGVSIEIVVQQLVYRAIQAQQQLRRQRYHDLDTLAGTWSSDESDEFLRTIDDFSKIDEHLWS